MGHRPANRIPENHGPPPRPPARPVRDEVEELFALIKAEYVADRIDAEEMEAAMDHVRNGGLGTEEFPYLPVFPMPQMEYVRR